MATPDLPSLTLSTFNCSNFAYAVTDEEVWCFPENLRPIVLVLPLPGECLGEMRDILQCRALETFFSVLNVKCFSCVLSERRMRRKEVMLRQTAVNQFKQ